MVRTESALADGRQIVYFDDVDRGRIPVRDVRELEPRPTQAELREDPLSGDWVVVAAHRQTRTFLPSLGDCPLCPGSEVPCPSYDVAVFENRWPSFSGRSDGLADRAAGRCEVVAFTDQHDLSFADLGTTRVRTVVDAWADRSRVLSEHPDIAYVACFENRGEAIGVTLHHPHGQVYGYPFVPPVIDQIVRRAKENPGLFAQVLADELADPRVVAADEHWVAYVPRAARWPYEVYVMPRRDVAVLEELTDDEKGSLAQLLPAVLGAFDRVFDLPVPYIAGWRQSPVATRDVRLHWRVFTSQRAPGKLKHLAGSESAYGAFVNDVAPEDAAAALRRAVQT